jgi:hypothetical protein
VVTRARAQAALGQVPPLARRHLDQLMFIAELSMVSGNENEPLRFYRRVEREFARPIAVSAMTRRMVLHDLEVVLRDYTERPHDPAEDGYAVVTAMITPVLGALPSASECFEAIATYPPEVAVGFLVREYFADDHYHNWNMRARIAEELASRGYGAPALAVYEDYLRNHYASKYGGYPEVARAARAVLGEDFERWYRGVRGRSDRRATGR